MLQDVDSGPGLDVLVVVGEAAMAGLAQRVEVGVHGGSERLGSLRVLSRRLCRRPPRCFSRHRGRRVAESQTADPPSGSPKG